MVAIDRIDAHREYCNTLAESDYKEGFRKIFNKGAKNERINDLLAVLGVATCLAGIAVAVIGIAHTSKVAAVVGVAEGILGLGLLGLCLYDIEPNRKKYADKLDAFKATHQIELKPISELPPVVTETIATSAA